MLLWLDARDGFVLFDNRAAGEEAAQAAAHLLHVLGLPVRGESVGIGVLLIEQEQALDRPSRYAASR